MTQIIATVAPHDAPDDHAPGAVVLVSAAGQDLDSVPVEVKTRSTSTSIDVTIDRAVTLRGIGAMAAVEVRGSRGQRYIRTPLPVTLLSGDCVVASPGWQ